MSDYETSALDDLSIKITKGTTPSRSMGGFSNFGVNYVKSESVTHSGFVDASKFQYISEENHQKLKRSQLAKDDILFSMAGVNLGKTAMVKEEHLPANTNQAVCLIRVNPSLAHPKFIFYSLRRAEVKHFALNATAQSAQPNINLRDIGSISIPLPPVEKQKAIAQILGTLDDKIELNQKLNQTLEEIAKAIFKSWFVDFGPVRAKAEGCPTGLPPEISDLFPDELVESEIGEIPSGWEVLPLNEFIVEVGQKTKPSPQTEQHPYVPIDCISSKSLTLWEHKDGEEAKSSLVSFKKGDILFGAMRPYFHKVCIAPFDGTTRTTCLVLNSKARDYFGFSLLTLFRDSTIDFAAQNSTGSTIPYIKWKNELETLSIPFPPVDLAEKFNSLLEPILAKFSIGIEELEVLSELRDTLLPKLISGELRIPDAEKFLEEAGI